MLDLGIDDAEEDLFEHSNRLKQGSGRIRYGQSTYVAALDGSGDFADIQEAINSLPSTGGTVYIKEGTYNIIQTITLNKNNISLVGVGNGTIIKANSDINAIEAISKTNLTIENLAIIGNSSTGAFTGNGIFFDGCNDSLIKNCWISLNNSGIYLRNSSTRLILTENIIFSNTESGIECDTTINCIFSNNVIYSNSLRGMDLQISSTTCIISGNIITLNTSNGILITGSYNIFKGNVITSNGASGITTSGGDKNIISGNVINSNTGRGILLQLTTTDNIISGNICNSNSSYGISTSGTRNIVAGNNLMLNTSGTIEDSGTLTQIGHNITE